MESWFPPVPEWDGLLPPVSCGERPIIDSVRTPVAYTLHLSSYAWCNLHRSHSSTRYVTVNNLRRSQLYTYLGSEAHLVLPLDRLGAVHKQDCVTLNVKLTFGGGGGGGGVSM